MSEPSRGPSRVVDRARAAVCCILLFAACFSQDPGLIAGDTKLDLYVDPGRFLKQSLQLWDPHAAFGLVQDQSYGYLFPMGPFFLAGHAIGLPVWVVQRAWQGTLLTVAFLGIRAVARRLDIGTPTTRLLGGFAYALSPLILSKLGPISSEALTECVAPWVLLPLVGDEALARPRTAAARSGVALLFAGGINASATLAILPLPAWWLLTRRPGGSRRRLVGWWIVAVILSMLWWLLPLAVFGTYSPPFIDWIENAATTTSTTNLLAVLSGTQDWVGHLTTLAGPIWRAGTDLNLHAAPVFDAALLAALGLLGLMRRDLPHRRVLVGAALIGLVLMTGGHSGPDGPAFATTQRHFLDGPLAAFRNLHKFDLLLRIPLALGLVHLATVVRVRLPEKLAGQVGRARVQAAGLIGVIAVLGVATPLSAHDLEPAGEFAAVPTWWSQTAAYLGRHDDGTRALLLPAAAHGYFQWGVTNDEPLEALATTPWAVRDAVPLGGAGERQLLDAVDAQVATGHGSPQLSAYLARAGVGWLVVRNDLDPLREDVVPPLVVRAALQNSSGITQVASIGTPVGNPGTGQAIANEGVTARLAPIQVYRVTGAAARVETQPVAATVRVSGDAGSVMPLIAAHLLTSTTAAVTAATPPVSGVTTAGQQRVVTDGNRRVEDLFGQINNEVSATLGPHQPWSQPRRVHAVGLGDSLPHQTTARIVGVAGVRASSSAADAAAFWLFGTTHDATAAFDGNPTTTWVSGATTAVGEWVEEDFGANHRPATISVSAPRVGTLSPLVSAVRIATAAGSEQVPVGTNPQIYGLPAGPTSWVRLTVTAVAGGGPGTAATLEASVAGIPPVSRALAVPPDGSAATGGAPGSRPPALVFTGLPQASGCVWLAAPSRPVCATSLVHSSEDELGLDRIFTLDRTDDFTLTAAGRPIGGPALDAALPLPHGVASVAVSSRLVDDPADGSEALLDDDPTTGWIASRVDTRPAVTVTLDGRRRVSGIQLTSSAGLPAAPPTRVVFRSRGRRSTAAVDPNGVVSLPSTITGHRFVLTFPTRADRTDTVGAQLPVGIGGLQLDFADGRATEPVPSASRFVEPCGSGPALSIDGAVQRTSVRGTLSGVMHDRDLTVHPCLVAGRHVTIGAGTHQVSLLRTATIRPDSLVMRPSGLVRPTTGPTRAVHILTWNSDTRRVSVAAGAASWLSLQENENAGWRATLNGHRLPSTIVDGWKQAFLVPAGAGGVVSIDFAPDHAFHIGLLAGAVAVLILLVLAGVGSAPRAIRARERPRRWGPRLLIAAGLLAVPAMVGIAGAIAVPTLAAVTWLVVRRWPRGASLLLRTVAVAGVVLAGVLAAWHPYGQLASSVADGRVAQWCCALSIAAVALSLLVPQRPDPAPARPVGEQTDV